MAEANKGQEPQVERTAQPSLEGATAEQLQSANPQLIKQLQKQGAAQERARIAEIREAALPGQETIAEELISSGASADDARKRFLEDAKGRNKSAREELLEDAEEPAGADPSPQTASFREPTVDELDALDDQGITKRAASDWAAHSEQLREDGFFSREAYEGHLRSKSFQAKNQVL